MQYIYFRKISDSNMGAPNLLLAPGAIQPRYAPGIDIQGRLMRAISIIFGSQVTLRVHYCKRDELHFTTLL